MLIWAVIIAMTAVVILYSQKYNNIAPNTSITMTNNDISPELTISGGCANIMAYKRNAAATKAVTIFLNVDEHTLSTTPQTFDLVEASDTLVSLDTGENLDQIYCNDVSEQGTFTNQSKATSGTVTISITQDSNQTLDERDYTTTMTLEDVYFTDEAGNELPDYISSATLEAVQVGWLPG